MVWVVSLLTVKLILDGLAAAVHPAGIRSLVGFGNGGTAPSPFSALPAAAHNNAVPKGISRRTSYLLVRLAFHLYPQFIRSVCNLSRFGPPRSFTSASSCPWIGHQVSVLLPTTTTPCGVAPSSDSLSLPLPV